MSEAAETYLMQAVEHGYLGNSPIFYAGGGKGYTQWIDDAHKFTAAECEDLIRSTRGSHTWRRWPWSQIDAAGQRTVDHQRLGRPKDTP